MVSPSGMALRGYGGHVHAELAALVGDDHVARDVVLADASGLSGRAAALVAPASAEEVAAVVGWCYDHDVAMVPVGGRRGYTGGVVPVAGGGGGGRAAGRPPPGGPGPGP